MKIERSSGSKHLFVFLMALLLAVTNAPVLQAKTTGSLLDTVVALKLGMNGYIIGQKLDTAQKEIAEKHPVEGGYQGTYKFVDNGLYVVVDQKTDRILALYKQEKHADRNQLKSMVAELMNQFDAPTTMAHDKILYWAFNRHGAVSEEDFNRAKKVQQTAELNIVATVKLNSEMEIAADPEEENTETIQSKTPETGSIYFIITSDPLVKEFMGAQK